MLYVRWHFGFGGWVLADLAILYTESDTVIFPVVNNVVLGTAISVLLR